MKNIERKPFLSKIIANFFIKKGVKEKRPLNQIKLQKLVYISHGLHLAILDYPLLNELVSIRQFGPSIPSLQNELRDKGLDKIKNLIQDFDIDTKEFFIPDLNSIPEDTKELLEAVWDRWGKLNKSELVARINQDGAPWKTSLNENPDVKKYNFVPIGATIPNEIIKKYYENLMDEH